MATIALAGLSGDVEWTCEIGVRAVAFVSATSGGTRAKYL